MTDTCTNCKFFASDKRAWGDGRCRRYPPVGRGTSPYDAFPKTQGDFWCGEFRRRPDAIEAKPTPRPWAPRGGPLALSKAKGGFARAENLSPERRSEIAKHAAETRWSNKALAVREEAGQE